MDTGMMLDWNAYRQQLLAGTGEIGRMNPDIVRGYRQLRGRRKSGRLDCYSARAMDAFTARSTEAGME